MGLHALKSPLHIAAHDSIRENYALGESCSTTGIINHTDVVGLILEIAHMFLVEELRILLTI